MSTQSDAVKTIRTRCYNCFNYMYATTNNDGGVNGTCPVCKSIMYTKRKSKTIFIKLVPSQRV